MRLRNLLLASVAWAAPLAGQADLRLDAGATYSSALLDDGVLSTRVRPAIAPTAALGIGIPTGKGGYRVVAEVSYTRAPLNVFTTAGVKQDQLAAVATITTLLLAEGRLRGDLRWQAGGGAVFYRPSEPQGAFQAGGPHRWIVAAGVTWTRPLTSTIDLHVTGRVDAHTFTSSVLQSRGYGSAQSVERLALRLGLSRRL